MDGGSSHFTESSGQDRPQEKKYEEAKWLSKEPLPVAEKRKVKWEKERYIYLNAEFQRIARRGKKAFLSDQCKDIEGERQDKDQLDDLDQLGLTYTYYYI